jgi:hypothetical protein
MRLLTTPSVPRPEFVSLGPTFSKALDCAFLVRSRQAADVTGLFVPAVSVVSCVQPKGRSGWNSNYTFGGVTSSVSEPDMLGASRLNSGSAARECVKPLTTAFSRAVRAEPGT